MTGVLASSSRLKTNIIWNYASGLASTFGLLLLYPLAVHISGAAAYGLWVLAFSAIQLFTLSDFGLGTGIVRLLASIPNTPEHHEERRKFVTVAVAVFLLVATLLTTLFIVLFPLYLGTVAQSPETTQLRGLLVPITAATLFVSIAGRAFNAVLWAEDRPDIERKSSLVSMLIRAVGYVFVLWSGHGIIGIVWVECITLAISPVVCCVAVIGRYSWPLFEGSAVRRHALPLVRLSGVLFIGTFSTLAALQVPIYVVGATMGLTAVTAFGGLMRVYQSARLLISWTANPFIHRITTAGKAELAQVMAKCFALTGAVAMLMGLTLALLAPQLLEVWLGTDFVFAAPALRMVAIGVLADAVIQVSSLVVNLRSSAWRISWANCGVLLVTIPLVYLAADKDDVLLTMLATVAAPALGAAFYLRWALRVAGLPAKELLDRKSLQICAGFAVLALLLGCVSSTVEGWPAVFAAGGVEVAAGLLVWRWMRSRSLGR